MKIANSVYLKKTFSKILLPPLLRTEKLKKLKVRIEKLIFSLKVQTC